MEPSQVRARILREHEVLRGLAHKTRVQAERAVSDNDLDALRTQVDRFWNALTKHMEGEEQTLEPILEKIDAWGPERVAAMKKMHLEQRETMGRIYRDLFRVNHIQQVASLIHALVQAVLADMDEEEKDLLHPDLLRDDCIVIAQSGG